MTELAPGTVTMGDLYRELIGMRAEVAKALTRIEVIDSRNRDADGIHADHETRLRQLEKFRFTIGGLALVGGALSGYIGYMLGHFVH